MRFRYASGCSTREMRPHRPCARTRTSCTTSSARCGSPVTTIAKRNNTCTRCLRYSSNVIRPPRPRYPYNPRRDGSVEPPPAISQRTSPARRTKLLANQEVSMSAETVKHYNMHEAKTHLSRIIERVESGEEVIIDRAGVPVARIIPLSRRVNRTAIGSLAGQLDL